MATFILGSLSFYTFNYVMHDLFKKILKFKAHLY